MTRKHGSLMLPTFTTPISVKCLPINAALGQVRTSVVILSLALLAFCRIACRLRENGFFLADGIAVISLDLFQCKMRLEHGMYRTGEPSLVGEVSQANPGRATGASPAAVHVAGQAGARGVQTPPPRTNSRPNPCPTSNRHSPKIQSHRCFIENKRLHYFPRTGASIMGTRRTRCTNLQSGACVPRAPSPLLLIALAKLTRHPRPKIPFATIPSPIAWIGPTMRLPLAALRVTRNARYHLDTKPAYI